MPAEPVTRLVGRALNPALMAPAALTAPLQGAPQSSMVVKTKADVEAKQGRWSIHERTSFLKIKMSSNKCWAKFVGKAGVARDAQQMKSQYETLYLYLKFTGGGADADVEPKWNNTSAVEKFLQSRAAGGHDIDGLQPQKVTQWLTLGWYDLFHNRYKENPKASRDVDRSSADTLSDMEGGLRDDNDDNDSDNDSDIKVIEKPTVPATPASTISKAKKGLATDPRKVKASSWDRSKPASRTPVARAKKEGPLQGLNNYLEGRVRVDEQAMKLAKVDSEFKRLKATEATAKEILADITGLYGEEAKGKARRVLEKLMDIAPDF
ncbi:hypothetical protein B0H16DRAFT_1569296 [Mycena metata]|uniref:Myb/SANT-like domain-containing protein n=1 Tax=Mycena metata TaxID=1033252 RepID=A0AAD7N0K0_9AGAR|nr:hypothetical protein B0H16DRAFT_1569296 [Mycena metata]